MTKAINLLCAAAFAAAALAAAVAYARAGERQPDERTRLCAERLCSVVIF